MFQFDSKDSLDYGNQSCICSTNQLINAMGFPHQPKKSGQITTPHQAGHGFYHQYQWKAWQLMDVISPSHRNVLFVCSQVGGDYNYMRVSKEIDILFTHKNKYSSCISRRANYPYIESPAQIQKDIFQNWNRYWAQATPVDVGTKNEWFVLTENLPS